jgi:hypothetical protein
MITTDRLSAAMSTQKSIGMISSPVPLYTRSTAIPSRLAPGRQLFPQLGRFRHRRLVLAGVTCQPDKQGRPNTSYVMSIISPLSRPGNQPSHLKVYLYYPSHYDIIQEFLESELFDHA